MKQVVIRICILLRAVGFIALHKHRFEKDGSNYKYCFPILETAVVYQ